jgi:peroxiredoxin (alkyl hydroperoxide reductase subunit C)
LIGDDAPSFKARTTLGMVNFPEDYKGKWVIFFSHPSDFTPVCTTEFIKCASMQEEFRQLNAQLLGLSVDSIYSHIAWLETIRDRIEYRGLKNIDVMFPVIEDLGMEVARKYGMIHPNAHYTPEMILEKFERSGGVVPVREFITETVRAVFIVDPMGKIRAILYYPFSNGRNMEEIRRLLIALQISDSDNVSTPEGWLPGDDVIIQCPVTWTDAKERSENSDEDIKCIDWFLCMRKHSP